MARYIVMSKLARWHIWLGWLIGLPLVMWTVTGLVMVSRPIEEVRGEHLRRDITQLALPANTDIAIRLPAEGARMAKSVTTAMYGGAPVTTITYLDDSIARFDATGAQLPDVGENAARRIVAKRIDGGNRVVASAFFPADAAPLELRRPIPSWRIVLENGAHVYVHQQTGEIAAVRTRFWRIFDVMWGLHIMDLDERSDTSHPVLIIFAALAAIGSMLGCVLLFRRRKTARAG